MNKAELWLVERMTVRRWLAAVTLVALLAAGIGYCTLAAVRPDDADAASLPVGLNGTSEQQPTSMFITVNVGSISLIDGRAGVTLQVYPTRLPLESTVTIRTLSPTPGVSVREIDLKGPEVRPFADGIDRAVSLHDPERDLIVAGTTIHAVEVTPGDYRYDLKSVGTMRLDADGMAEVRRILTRSEAYRTWLAPRVVPLRLSNVPPMMAAADGPLPVSSAARPPGK